MLRLSACQPGGPEISACAVCTRAGKLGTSSYHISRDVRRTAQQMDSSSVRRALTDVFASLGCRWRCQGLAALSESAPREEFSPPA